MKLDAKQLANLYCTLMHVLFPDDPGVKDMLAKADHPEVRARPGPASGLRDAINDLFAMHGPFIGRERELIDEELARRGLPSLHIIEASRTKQYRGIIKRRKIRNEDEFYLVKGLLDDQDPILEESELTALAEVMDAYLREQTGQEN